MSVRFSSKLQDATDAVSTKTKKTNKTQFKAVSHHRAKDEIEYATNWRRSFHTIYMHCKWLNAYAKINYIAAFKIVKKFIKTHCELKDNVLDKKLKAYVEQKTFAKRLAVHELIR